MTLVGVNAPYLLGQYGHDLAPNGRFPDWPVAFDPMHAYRPLIEGRELGFDAIRVWLCENAEGIVLDGDQISGVHEDLLESIRVIQEAAVLNGVRVYWSLLDGNAVAREGDPITRSILTDPAQRARFVEHVVTPVAVSLDPKTTFALEIINEPETATSECMADAEEKVEGVEPVSWDDIGATLRESVAAVDGRFLVTAGTMHVFLKSLWASDPRLTAIDVHVYHPRGGLPSASDLATYVGDEAIAALPLVGGECGIPKDAEEEPFALFNYIFNADKLGYAAAFLWQLEGDFVDAKAPRRPFTNLGWKIQTLLRERRA
ncbi:MAG: hypothetical protein AAGE52_20235 [Myxococcota bacterium]